MIRIAVTLLEPVFVKKIV